MTGHADRAHAQWSASSSAANFACPGRLRMVASVDVPEKESEAAAWGTAAHEVAEDCLRNGREAAEWIGRFVTTKQHRIEVDEEVAECAQVYVDYVRRLASGPGVLLQIEQRFSLAALNPPFEAGGTGDAVLALPIMKALEVVDLKGGRGVVVEAKGNPQLRTYALGALLASPGLAVEHVTVTIVQPRAPHPDGRIRSETFHVADLLDWTTDLLAAMRAARHAWAEYDRIAPAGGADLWGLAYLIPGNHCRFCPAAGMCPALARKAEAEAKIWFKDESGEQKRNTPDRLVPEEIARILDHADLIQDHLNAVRAYAHAQAEKGVAIPGYVLVEKRGREAWCDGTDDEVVAACEFAGLDEAKYRNPGKLRTPKQVREALKKVGFEAPAGWSAVPSAGTSLVAADKTTREAVPSMAQRFFTTQD
ncbi:MAG: DUF2800 domain-containing protein [Methylorubrum rhodinum]|uniref:DUF2800 domain-containing protein n=1 Tax=Methylorubrum rhodinum TaxID=29428 RepID=UPI003BAF2A90